MNVNSILFDQTNTLRSGWRFAVFLLAFMFAAMCLGIVVFGVITAAGLPIPLTTGMILNSFVLLIPALAFGWLLGKRFERLPFRTLGASFTSRWLRHFLLGCFFGAVTVGIAIIVAVLFGGLKFSVNEVDTLSIVRAAAFSFALFAIAASWEEALFRGYILQTFIRADLTTFAVIFTSILFATLHNGNPSANIFSWINTFVAGVWFGVAYLKTRDLWFVWGMHLIWNWMQGSIFGIEVSGLTDITKASLLKEADSGPAWLTGGDYGIEGGIACTVALVLSTLAIQFLPIVKPVDEMVALTSPRALPSSKVAGQFEIS